MSAPDPRPATLVPCNGCFECCRNDQIFLHAECGDDPAQYDAIPARNPLSGADSFMLRHKPNGDCIYLDRATGCTIWERRPTICREYDCRVMYLRLLDLTRTERRTYIARGLFDKAKIKAGRVRLNTLPDYQP